MRVSKDEGHTAASWFETRAGALLTMRGLSVLQSYFFTSGHSLWLSGRAASSGAIVAICL